MKIFISGAGSNPSGGHKVLNQVVNLFIEKGLEAYCVVPGKKKQAHFLSEPAPVLNYSEVPMLCSKNDVIIDLWPLKKIYENTKICSAETKVFWQHGVSLPVGPDFVGEKIFSRDSCYNQHWNVSQVCAEFYKKKYNIEQHIVNPFFDTPIQKKYSLLRNDKCRKGILLLSRRGREINDRIIARFGNKHKITILAGYFHEEDFYKLLLEHEIFVCADAGIGERPYTWKSKSLQILKQMKNKMKLREANSWLVPKEKWLGFPMPPVESALCGCSVVAFAMGGGLEWMQDCNCFLAKDKNWEDLLAKLNDALHCSQKKRNLMRENAFQKCSKFNKINTWQQLSAVLPL